MPSQYAGDLASHHYQNIKGIFKDHAANLFILDTEAQQDVITAKATQQESRTAGPEPGAQMPRLEPSPPPLRTNHRRPEGLRFLICKNS